MMLPVEKQPSMAGVVTDASKSLTSSRLISSKSVDDRDANQFCRRATVIPGLRANFRNRTN
jgi:hypothetical protein